eukprot:8179452-Alexandrium_andersonii.AAC.1
MASAQNPRYQCPTATCVIRPMTRTALAAFCHAASWNGPKSCSWPGVRATAIAHRSSDLATQA